MPNTREKLIELLAVNCPMKKQRCVGCDDGKYYSPQCKSDMYGETADRLIANGIIVPPVKIGQKVYTIPRSAIREWTVCGVWISADPECSYAHIYWEKNGHHMESRAVNFGDIDRVLFLSREEAEAALTKHRKENDYD